MVNFDAWLRIGLSIDIVSGFIFLAFGAFAAFKRPRTKAGAAVGLFALGWTSVAIYPNWYALRTGSAQAGSPVDSLAANLFNVGGFLLVAVGIIWLCTILNRGWPKGRISSIIFAIICIDVVWVTFNAWQIAPTFDLSGIDRVAFTATNALAGTLAPLLIWLAISVPDEGSARWMALAVTPLAGAWFLTNGVDFARSYRLAALVPHLFVMAIALPVLARRQNPRLLLWTLSWWSLAFAWGWALAGQRPNDLGLIGATRILAVAILVYAVVRYRAFDIDVKLRFTLRQSTVAAIFVAVFVAVQAAVGEYVTATAGILAGAGATALLVFGLGPIQKFAENFAARALPDAVPIEQRTADDRAILFEALAREAWSDGSINAKEGRVLETAWRRLGLSAEQAAQIESRARAA